MPTSSAPFTIGSESFDPSSLLDDDSLLEQAIQHLNSNNLYAAITSFFSLASEDSYVYHATTSVSLAQVQAAIAAGPANGLHDWYLNPDSGTPTGQHPPSADTRAYISIFDPRNSAANTLKSFQANAKKGSLRTSIAAYLLSKRHLDASLAVPKLKATATPHANPYFTFWAWSCLALQSAGPDGAGTARVHTSHHVLPVFMHHFGCVCPSWEALSVVAKVAARRTVLDIGSGNGYWTLMLRRLGCEVVAVDSQQSVYRTCWIGDTVIGEGVAFISRRKGAAEDVLLLVYPIVSGEFTRKVLDAYKGNCVCIAGTENGNGYTGFKDVVADEWMRENRPAFEKVAQVALPSFAGKDDALFVFWKKT